VESNNNGLIFNHLNLITTGIILSGHPEIQNVNGLNN